MALTHSLHDIDGYVELIVQVQYDSTVVQYSTVLLYEYSIQYSFLHFLFPSGIKLLRVGTLTLKVTVLSIHTVLIY